jgi:hypothetical protein
MKFTLKLLLIVVLFCGTAMADGDMGGGGGFAPTICETTQTTEGDMGGGGGLAPASCTDDTGTIKISDSLSVYVFKFVISFLR